MHFSTIRLAIMVLALSLLPHAPASALEQKAFDANEFKLAQDAGKPVVIHVTAPWCPTCKAQHDALNGLAKNPAFAEVTVYQVDFDSQVKVWKSFNARSQSTIIAFAGNKETARAAGTTAPDAIEALLLSTVTK